MRLEFNNIINNGDHYTLGYVVLDGMPDTTRFLPLLDISHWIEDGYIKPEIKDAIIEYIRQEYGKDGTHENFIVYETCDIHGIDKIEFYVYCPGILASDILQEDW